MDNLKNLCINTIRTLAMDAVQAANSGHPGAAMALAPVAFTLYNQFMKFDPANPHWINRDRFILSAGHASMLLYGTLFLHGFDVSLDDIKAFRQLNSKTPGHPEYGHTPGVETTTGPLGQGLATSVGFAIAQKFLAERFNRPGFNLIDYAIFSIAGDGCMMEGISSEAASLAGHLGLDNLIWIYDSNRITIEGDTNLAFSEDVATRFKAYGWNVAHVSDANDTQALTAEIARLQALKGAPGLVIVNSHIAYGAPTKQDSHSTHGSPLGAEEIRGTKQFYGWDPDKSFYVPAEVSNYANDIKQRGAKQSEEWSVMFRRYLAEFPEAAAELQCMMDGQLPEGWDADIPVFEAGAKISGRAAGGKVLNAIAGHMPLLISGSADLAPSTLTDLKGVGSFQKVSYSGRNLHYGIREHAMGSAANGIALSGLRNVVSTFLVFSDYMRSSIRLSALMKLPVTYVFTHDSIGVGEDGPTHQPVEHVASLRAIPGLDVIRPGDAAEVAAMWRYAMQCHDRPVAFILSRQDLPVIDRSKYASANGALKGAYVMNPEITVPDVIIIATGSEVSIALEATEQLLAKGVKARLVSMPAAELFERQSIEYRESVLPSAVSARVAVEAGTSFGWNRFTGLTGAGSFIGIDHFGASGKPADLYSTFGITAKAVVDAADALITKD